MSGIALYVVGNTTSDPRKATDTRRRETKWKMVHIFRLELVERVLKLISKRNEWYFVEDERRRGIY